MALRAKAVAVNEMRARVHHCNVASPKAICVQYVALAGFCQQQVAPHCEQEASSV